MEPKQRPHGGPAPAPVPSRRSRGLALGTLLLLLGLGAAAPARAALRMIFESKTTEQVAHTAYGLVQAAGEYLDHVRSARSWETRLNRSLIRPEPLKHRALSLAREVITA